MDNKEDLHNTELTAKPNQPAGEKPASHEPEPEPTIGQWLRGNLFVLGILGALFVYLYLNFDSSGLWAIGKAALGLSFVIFIHELGHFLVAKWCDVHVTTFSIGFGPPIPGCSFQWGETNYRLALFPLGGYVQMVGQVDGDESSDGNEDDPRSYRNKTVWQRMAIISAGVVMNVILAIVCFVIVFQGPGKDRQEALVSAVDSGSPAFIHGLRWEGEIEQIGTIRNPYFENLMTTVMATRDGEKLVLSFKRPQDREATTLEIEPILSKGEDSRPMVGLSPAFRAILRAARDFDPSVKKPVLPQSIAALTDVQFGDRVIATTDPDNPNKMKDLPPDPRKADQPDFFEYLRRMQLLAGKEVTIEVERGAGDTKERVKLKVAPAFHYTFGARMQMGQIVALRDDSPAVKAGVRARKSGQEGDVIFGVEVREPDGKTVTRWGTDKPLDPVRLPYDLKQWAARIAKANPNAKAADYKVILRVAANNNPGPNETRELTWDKDWQFDKILPFHAPNPQAIPELGLAYQVTTTIAYIPEEMANSTGLKKDDVVKKIRFYYLNDKGEKKEGPWATLGADEFAWVFHEFQYPGAFGKKDMTVVVERLVKDKDTKEIKKETKEIDIQADKDLTWPLAERGFLFSRDVRRQKANSFFDAVGLGFKDTYDNMTQVYQNLRGMIEGRISVKNLGGPITIARVAYRIAGYDFWEFLFFIGMISVNLAVINFLPIPVLDGGHMVFLIYEKIRGKPASEGVRVATTYAGLALILCLMVFVLFQDISRLIRGS